MGLAPFSVPLAQLGASVRGRRRAREPEPLGGRRSVPRARGSGSSLNGQEPHRRRGLLDSRAEPEEGYEEGRHETQEGPGALWPRAPFVVSGRGARAPLGGVPVRQAGSGPQERRPRLSLRRRRARDRGQSQCPFSVGALRAVGRSCTAERETGRDRWPSFWSAGFLFFSPPPPFFSFTFDFTPQRESLPLVSGPSLVPRPRLAPVAGAPRAQRGDASAFRCRARTNPPARVARAPQSATAGNCPPPSTGTLLRPLRESRLDVTTPTPGAPAEARGRGKSRKVRGPRRRSCQINRPGLRCKTFKTGTKLGISSTPTMGDPFVEIFKYCVRVSRFHW